MPDLILSVVIPFFNEQESCVQLLGELRQTLEGLAGRSEVLVINDGSTDQTLTNLRQLALEWPAVRVFSLLRNSGQAAALYIGMKAARGSIVVTMDGDGQNVPGDIPLLLNRLREGSPAADMVAGIRVDRQDSWLRIRMSRFANAIRNWALGDGMTDSGCALKAFRREVVDAFLPMRTLYSFMPALAVAAGFKVVEQPVQHRERNAGISKYGFFVMLWRPALDMVGIWWWRHRRFALPEVAKETTVA